MSFSIGPACFDISLLPPGPVTPVSAAGATISDSRVQSPFKFYNTAFPSVRKPLFPPKPFVFRADELVISSDLTLNCNWFGTFDFNKLANKAESWLYTNGVRGQIKAAVLHFLDNCQRHHFRFEHQAVCLSLRIERQKDTFNVPNPHHDGDDGRYWDRQPGDPDIFKLGGVLLGPGTVFYETDDPSAHWAVKEGRKKKSEQGWTEKQIREWLDEGFRPVGKRHIRPGEIARWIVGNDCKGAIHSEPNMSDMPGGRVL